MNIRHLFLKQKIKDRFGLSDDDFKFRTIKRGQGSEESLYNIIYDFEYEGNKFTYNQWYEAWHEVKTRIPSHDRRIKLRLYAEYFGVLNTDKNPRKKWIEKNIYFLNEKGITINNISNYNSKVKSLQIFTKNNPYDTICVDFPYMVYSEDIPIMKVMNLCKIIQDKIEEITFSNEEFKSLVVDTFFIKFENENYVEISKTFSNDLFV